MNVAYAVLYACDVMYVFDIKCYVHVVLHACLCVVLCTYGVVCMILQVVMYACGAGNMLYKWHYVQVVLCTCGVKYMSCMWYVHIVLCARCTSGVVYVWCCVHIMQVALCTYDVVQMLCKSCGVQVVLCTCCTYDTTTHVVLCACHTCCVEGMWYYVCALCSHGIMTYAFIMLNSIYIFV